MYVIQADNVTDGLCKAVDFMKEEAVRSTSRAGDVLVSPVPVTVAYMSPCERVLFDPVRDANPYFHFMEGLWMIAGRNDVDWISQFSQNISQFSDDGSTFHGAYGHRWRKHFDFDQLDLIISLLQNDPHNRRIVLQMWDPTEDIARDGKDFPCNTNIYFRVVNGKLDMTVCCRSNDMVWGTFGANAVHMSMLLEYMASSIGVGVGTYYQVSNNFHAYLDTWSKVQHLKEDPFFFCQPEGVKSFPMINKGRDNWDRELSMFMSDGDTVMGYRDPFFKKVAAPMLSSWGAWKDKDITKALMFANSIAATDWRKACTEWLERRT